MILPEDGILEGQPGLIRQVAVELLNKYVPSDWGDPTFQEIIRDYGGSGTTCGFLAHWLIWRLGCRSTWLVNRTDKDSGLIYHVGKNISRLRWNDIFRIYDGTASPAPGDIVFVSNGPPETEHVLCYLGEEGANTWVSADAGQRHPRTGGQCARIRRRTFIDGALTDVSSTRRVQGWLPLDRLTLTAPATLCVAS